MAKSGIEMLAAKALKEFLISKSELLASGMTSSGRPINQPIVTTSTATPPKDSGPFIAISVKGREIEFADSSPLSIESSALRVTIILRDYIEAQVDDDQPYEASNENHLNIGDRIIGELFKAFNSERTISESQTGFSFKIIPANGIQKNNSGIAWETPSYYVVAISEIIFSLGSACEQATY